MPKIRGFKPELWTDDDFVEVSAYARLLWLGMWNFACDNGHLQDKSKQIKGRVLPMDDVNCAELLRELEGQGLIDRCDGWITVPNLTHHQRPHKRWWTTCEMPGCELPEGTSHAPSNRGATVAKRGRNRSATGEGEVEGELTLKVIEEPSSDKSDQTDRFDEFWNTYGNKVGRKTAAAKYGLALKKPGVTPDLLIAAASAYVTWERANNEGGRYIKHPATWLNGEHWTDERTTRPAPLGRAAQGMALARQLAEEDNPTPQIGPSR